MKKNSISNFGFAVTGIGIGIPVTLVCMTLIGGFNEIVAEFLIWTVASALFGVISGAAFYTDHDLSFPAALALHCVGCLTVATAAAVLCGYISSFMVWLTAMVPVFVIVYAVVYAFCILMMKIREKQINDALSQE